MKQFLQISTFVNCFQYVATPHIEMCICLSVPKSLLQYEAVFINRAIASTKLTCFLIRPVTLSNDMISSI